MVVIASRVSIFLAFCLFCASATIAQAELVVAAGHSVSVMTLSSVDQACHAKGNVAINVVEQPRGGYILISRTTAYPNFTTLNSRVRCNTLKLPATRVDYQSAGNYLGLDYVTLEAIFPDGDVKRIRVAVSVRAIGPAKASQTFASERFYTPSPRHPHVRHAQMRIRHAHLSRPKHPRCGASCAARAPQVKGPHRATKPAEARPLLTPI